MSHMNVLQELDEDYFPNDGESIAKERSLNQGRLPLPMENQMKKRMDNETATTTLWFLLSPNSKPQNAKPRK